MEFLCDTPGLRLDRFLAARLPDYSRALIQEWIKEGLVLVNGRCQKPRFNLQGTEKISFSFPKRDPSAASSREERFLYEDKFLLIMDKPAGLIMHPLSGTWLREPQACLWEREPSVAETLYRLRPELTQSGVQRLGIVHRLDRQTSGVLIVAKTQEAQKNLLRQFKNRLIEKRYRAIVRGRVKDHLHVVAPIGRLGMSRNLVASPFGKSAETKFRVLKTSSQASLVEACPLTGRTHQIRAHLAFAGFPVAGDFLFDRSRELPLPPRLMLHAFQISFLHPQRGKKMSFRAPLPGDFKDFWNQCQTETPPTEK